MQTYLIIGHLGTLGNEFRELLNGQELLLADRSELDITDPNSVAQYFSAQKPDVVINCAAYTNVDGAETDYNSALLVNATALKFLSENCNKAGATLIHFSTGMVFLGEDPNGYNEDDATDPINRYGESKLQGEKIIQATAEHYYIIRTEWLYGKPQSSDAKKSFVEIMLNLGHTGKVKAVNDEHGKPTWAKDLAMATLALIDSKAQNGIYHLINEGSASREDWTREIYKLRGMDVEIESVPGTTFPRPAKRPEFELLNNTKLPKLRTWQAALKEYLNS